MKNFVLKNINSDSIEPELSKIGFDSTYIKKACDKYKYKNIKIFDLTPAQANILKQTALSVGADCATHREVITGKAEMSDVILGGSISQLKKISEKLKIQPFSLKLLGEQTEKFLQEQKRKTKLVGILNVTPDSFSDGGKYTDPKKAQEHLMRMISDGADMIDIGAESTRPNSAPVSAKEQIERLKPILEFIQKENISVPVSVDTRASDVADFALNNGARIINDVSGFDYDVRIADVISKYSAGVIIQHSKGNAEDFPEYKNLIDEIYLSLRNKIEFAKEKGINNIIADMGIGFGKTKEQNFEILNRVEEFYSLNVPVMLGVSRKRLLGVQEDDNELKDTLSVALSYPLFGKVDYLRVHNVKLHSSAIKMLPDWAI